MVKHLLSKTASGLAAAAFLFVLPQSCVNEEYDLAKEIDTTVSFGGDALVFPLGSTEKMKFSTFLSEDEFEFLTSGADGKYRIEFSDEFNFNDDIPNLSEELENNIDDIVIDDINIEIPIDFADIKGTSFGPENIESSIVFDDMTLPEIDLSADIPQQTFSTNLSEYIPDDGELTLSAGGSRTIEFPDIVDLSAYADIIPDGPQSLSGSQINDIAGENLRFDGNTDFSIKTTFSGNITGISSVRFDPEKTGIRVTLKLINPFFDLEGGSGSIIPDIRLDLSGLLKFEGGLGTVDLSSMKLSSENGFEDSAVFPIEELVLDSGDCTTDGNTTTLDKTATISAEGGTYFDGTFTTDRETISNAGGAFGILLEVSVTDFSISDMTFGIKPVEVNENQDIDFALEPISLPDDITVRAVPEIRMESGSSIDISISAGSLSNIQGLSTELNSLIITFPDIVESPAFESGNTYTVTGLDIARNQTISIPVEKVLPPEVVNNQITVDETVRVQAVATASGEVSLSELRQAAAGNSDITVDISTDNLVIKDYTLQVDPVVYEVEKEETVEVELPDGVKDIGNITVIPEGAPEVLIQTTLPSVEGIELKGDNLVLKFPEMLVFGDAAIDAGYDPLTHSITFNDAIPQEIRLPIASLDITPEQNQAGKYTASGKVSISGNVEAVPSAADGTVTSGDIQTVLDSEIGIKAEIQEVTVASVAIDKFETDFEQKTTFTLFDFGNLPDELVSIDRVYLSGTALDLSMDAANIPDMNAPVKFNVDVVLPPEIVVDSRYADENQNNILHISGELDADGHFSPEPIIITELNLKDLNLDQTGPYTVEISVDGSVFVDEPSINVEELTGNINVSVTGEIPVRISKVTGYVDYRLDTEDANRSIDIKSELPDILQDADFTLDLANPYVVLTVKTNLGIPVEGTLQLIPYYDNVADDGKTQEISISLDPAASINETETTVFYISGSDKGVPAGGKWIEADIASLLADLPDRIDIKIDAGTVSGELSTVEIVDGTPYTLELAYDVVAPLEFGEDMRIAMDYTYPEDKTSDESGGNSGESGDDGLLPDILGELLNMNSLGLSGQVESTLPLQLTMTAVLLDSDKNVIPSEPLTMEIQAGSADNPSVSDIDFILKLAEGADGTDLSYIKLNFEVSSGNMSGEPVTTESFVQATLKAKVPGGVTVDISSLGESENQDENL